MPSTARATTATAAACETIEPARAEQTLEADEAIGKQDHQGGRRQRESRPGRQGPGEAGARDSPMARPTWLLAGPGEELAERDEIRVGPRVEPAPARHELPHENSQGAPPARRTRLGQA